MERQRAIADWLKVAILIFGAGILVASNASDHRAYSQAVDHLARTDTVLAQRLDSLRAIGADVRDIKTLICKDHPDDSLCGKGRR